MVLFVGKDVSISLSKFSLHAGQIEWLIGSRGSSLSGISLKRMNLPHHAQTILRCTDSPPFFGHKKSPLTAKDQRALRAGYGFNL